MQYCAAKYSIPKGSAENPGFHQFCATFKAGLQQ
jgi:hypothetical protein